MAKPKQNKPLKPEWIKFSQHYVEYGSAAQSYLYAYPGVTYGTARTNGSKLLTNTDIAEYIEQLKEEFKIQYNITLEKIQRNLTIIEEESRKAYQFSAAVAANKEMARLAGIDPAQKIEHSGIPPIQINLIKPNEPDSEDKQD